MKKYLELSRKVIRDKYIRIAQKMKFSIKSHQVSIKFPADLVTFTEEIPNRYHNHAETKKWISKH